MTACEANQLAWTIERSRLRGHTLHQFGFATVCSSEQEFANQIVCAHEFDGDLLESQVEQVLREFQQIRRHANWVLGPSSKPEDLGKHLRSVRRMMGPMHLPAMELPLSDYNPQSTDHPVAKVTDWDAILAQGHPAVLWNPRAARTAAAEQFRELDSFGNADFLVAYVEGKLASAATVFYSEGTAGIYDVVTKPEFRGRGAATAVLNAALARARDHECEVAILQAHKKSVGLYHSLGFQERGLFKAFYYSRPRMESDARSNGL